MSQFYRKKYQILHSTALVSNKLQGNVISCHVLLITAVNKQANTGATETENGRWRIFFVHIDRTKI